MVWRGVGPKGARGRLFTRHDAGRVASGFFVAGAVREVALYSLSCLVVLQEPRCPERIGGWLAERGVPGQGRPLFRGGDGLGYWYVWHAIVVTLGLFSGGNMALD